MRRRHLALILCLAAATTVDAGTQAADIDGAWNLLFQTQAGPRENSLSVLTDGDTATATLGDTELTGTWKDGVLLLEGEHYAAEAGYTDTLKLEGRLVEGELRGESSWGQYVSTFVGTRPEE